MRILLKEGKWNRKRVIATLSLFLFGNIVLVESFRFINKNILSHKINIIQPESIIIINVILFAILISIKDKEHSIISRALWVIIIYIFNALCLSAFVFAEVMIHYIFGIKVSDRNEPMVILASLHLCSLFAILLAMTRSTFYVHKSVKIAETPGSKSNGVSP